MPKSQEFPFDFEFLNQTQHPDAELYEMAYQKITAISEGHTDITGASVSMEELSSGETPYAYQARVVLYVRSENIAATEEKPSAIEALQRALDAAIRQIRDKRENLKNY